MKNPQATEVTQPAGALLADGRSIHARVATLGRLRKSIIDTVGCERARAIIARTGFACGFQDAIRLRDAVAWPSVEAWLRVGPQILREAGLAEATLDRLETESPAGELACEIQWERSFEVEMHLEHFAPGTEPVCWELTGYLSGFMSACLGTEVRFLEQECAGARGTVCRATGRPRHAWDPATLRTLQDFEQEDLEAELSGVYEELMRINEQLTDLTQSATDAIVATNVHGHIKVFNRAAERLFGYQAHAVLGRSLGLLLPEPAYEGYQKALDEFLKTGNSDLIGRSQESGACRSDGELIPIEISISASNLRRDPLFTVIARDITERKRLEAERREKAIDLEATLNSTSDGLLLVKYLPAGETITLANKRLGELFDLDPAQLLGRPARELHRRLSALAKEPALYDELVRRIDRDREARRCDTIEFLQPTALFVERTTGPVHDTEGEIIGRIWSYRDITPQRRAELRIQGYAEELERTVAERTAELEKALEDLTKADELKSRFISNVSHEFRTPLTSVRGFTETILLNPNMDDETMTSFLKIIQDETDRLSHLIEDLLDMSRIEAGRFELSLGPTRVGMLAQQAAAAVRPMIDEKKLSLRVQTHPEEPVIIADSDRLYRVILNLVSNALKCTPEGGLITVGIDPCRGQEAVEIRVADTGIGIPADQLHRIFKPFEQIERPKNMHVGGTGLGLAIVSNLVEAHHGTIAVESEEGVGTVFTIRLPVQQPAPSPAE
ncbi:MAG: ATP-binding protein [Planctomycetota bacterium]